jgi:thiol-disulfide isomerase/thioredoxin
MIPKDNQTKIIQLAVFGLLLIVGFVFIIVLAIDKEDPNEDQKSYSNQTTENPEVPRNTENEQTDEISIETSPRYPDYSPQTVSDAEGNIVLFFHAAWCPTCIALNEAIIEEIDNIPDDVTIVKVDFDTEDDLLNKYNVFYQHTLVQVDSQGNELKKWFGSPDLETLLSEIK